jgi:hypothetical protein
MARSGRRPGRRRSRAIRSPITTTMAQSRLFLIPAGGQFGFQLAGVPAWPPAGTKYGTTCTIVELKRVPGDARTLTPRLAASTSAISQQARAWLTAPTSLLSRRYTEMSTALPLRSPGPGAGEHERVMPVSDKPGTPALTEDVDPVARHPQQPGHAVARHRAAGRRPPGPMTARPAAAAVGVGAKRAGK